MQNAIEVKEVDFHGDRLVTFQVKGEPHVAMRRVVENLGLSWGGQRDKLRGQSKKYHCTDIRTVDAAGRDYKMLAIPVAKLPLWLACINPNKVKDSDKRGKIELYQERSAQALHDFWSQGVAIRDDYAGLVTDLDPKVVNVLGGVMKAVVSKAVTELVPAMVEAQLASREIGVVHGVTAHDVIKMAGVENRKGLRGLGVYVSNRLRRAHAEKGAAVKLRDAYGDVSVLVYDKLIAREWLASGGRALINDYIERRRGQGGLRLVS